MSPTDGKTVMLAYVSSPKCYMFSYGIKQMFNANKIEIECGNSVILITLLIVRCWVVQCDDSGFYLYLLNKTKRYSCIHIPFILLLIYRFAATTLDVDSHQHNVNGIKSVTEKTSIDDQKPTANHQSDIIQDIMGQFGRWHFLVCSIVFLLKFPVAWHQMSIIFIGPKPKFHCIEDVDPCSDQCPSLIFDRTVFLNTINMEWNLVCKNEQWANFAQMVFMFGILVGNILFGTLADK